MLERFRTIGSKMKSPLSQKGTTGEYVLTTGLMGNFGIVAGMQIGSALGETLGITPSTREVLNLAFYAHLASYAVDFVGLGTMCHELTRGRVGVLNKYFARAAAMQNMMEVVLYCTKIRILQKIHGKLPENSDTTIGWFQVKLTPNGGEIRRATTLLPQ